MKKQIQRIIRDKSNESSKIELRRSKRDEKETNLKNDFYTFLIYENFRFFKEAITSIDAPL